ncbi:MAG TPA: hypothetical protein VG204_00790 [Terriglobia bacterium]|nr:hypothetical protein [Terriglobia bacterium]
MRRSICFFCLLLFATNSLGKNKRAVTIQVVDTQTSTRERAYYIPGTNAHSTTNCTSNATAVDLGGTATANGTTDCTTTTTPGRPASTGVRYIPQAHVHAIMSNGAHITLWCQAGFRHCNNLEPGTYGAEIVDNSVWVYTHDLGGKEHKIKYRYVGGW